MLRLVLVAASLGACGLLGGIAIVMTPVIAAGAMMFGLLVGVLAATWVGESMTELVGNKTWAGLRAGAVVAAWVTAGCLVLTGLVLLLGSASGSALLLLAVLSAVWLWRRRPSGPARRVNPARALQDGLRHIAVRPEPLRLVERPRRALPQPAEQAPVRPRPWSTSIPADLSTLQLCLAWQHTYFILLDQSADVPRGEIVVLRERLLDEIERRDPDGFTRWLDTGARAGSNPGRYLAGGR